MTPERKREIEAAVEEILGPRPLPKPKVVTSDGATIRDADVQVGSADPNAGGTERVVVVRRENWVTVNLREYERQQWDRAAEREYRRQLDPFKLGLYGPIDDDE